MAIYSSGRIFSSLGGKKVSKELKITTERIKKIHDGLSGCSEAQDAIKDAFPEAFEEEWRDITMSLKFIPDSRQGNGFHWVGIYVEGASEHFGFIDGKGVHICDPDKSKNKVELNSNNYFRILRHK